MNNFLKNITFIFVLLRKNISFVCNTSLSDVNKMKTVCRSKDHLMIKKSYILYFLLLISVSAYSQQSNVERKVVHVVSDSVKSQLNLDSLKSQKLPVTDSLSPQLIKTLQDSLTKNLPGKGLPSYNNDQLEKVENGLLDKTRQFNQVKSTINSYETVQIDSASIENQINDQQERLTNKALQTLPELDTALIDSYSDSVYLASALENKVGELVAPQLSELDQNVLGLNSYRDHFAENTAVIDQLQAKLSKKNLNAINLFSKIDTLNKVSLKDRMKVKPRVSVLGFNPVILQGDGVLIYKLGEELQIGGGLRYQTHISLKDEDDFRIHSTNQAFGGLAFLNLQLPKSFGFFIEGFYQFKAPSYKPTIGITKEIEILHQAFSFMIIYDPKVTESIQFGIRL